MVGRNKLCVGVDRDERPLVAKPLPIVAPLQVHLLLADVGPDFVALNALAVEITFDRWRAQRTRPRPRPSGA
jgi:hypothetical protein